jgi:hypothetical protein
MQYWFSVARVTAASGTGACAAVDTVTASQRAAPISGATSVFVIFDVFFDVFDLVTTGNLYYTNP